MLIRHDTHADDEQWAPVSDLMAVIMLVFMLITLILLVHFDLEKRSNIEQCNETRKLLDMEFHEDFKQWNTELDQDLTIRFTNQVILFEVAETIPGDWFADKISRFFPRYMNIIENIKTKFGNDEILAIHIEGHTSSEYADSKDIEEAFLKNMQLSQDRAREIIKSALALPEAENYKHIVLQQVKADGLSSSKLICINGQEDKNSSRRVEFKLLTNACQKAGVYEQAKPLTNSCGTGT